MSFDPNKHMIKTRGGKEYLPVAARLVWFRMEHPDWGILTEPHTIDMEKQFAIYRATIMDGSGKIIATATKQETVKDFPDFLEKSETGAVGRALAMCGYGTQFAPEFEEVNERGDGRVVDAPSAFRDSSPTLPPMPARAITTGTPILRESTGARPNLPPARPAPAGAAITRVREEVTDENLDPGGDAEIEDGEFLEADEAAPAVDAPPRPEPIPARTNSVAAPPPQNAPRPMPPAPNAAQAAPSPGGVTLTKTKCSSEGCPAVLTQSQLNMSTTKFGKPLCPLHQRDARPLDFQRIQ